MNDIRRFDAGPPSDRAEAWLSMALGLSEGDSPFPWQRRLLRLFRDGEVPRSLDVPTGLGKTATMAIWLIARALGANVPRRLVYVVDRRAVVDQATKVAEDLRSWVDAEAVVREALGLTDRSLPVSTLRGQFVDNREWLEDPSAPAIVVGTVDMVGSRLLFEGYRSSRKIRPYLAGVLGSDTLFVLDEAHLVPPFERLLERIALEASDLGPSGEVEPRPPTPRLLSLSATGRSRGGEPFDLDESDLLHPVVAQRLGAPKRVVVERLESNADLAEIAATRAWELSSNGDRCIRCIVFLTKREDAEKAKAKLAKLAGLDKQKKGDAPAAAVELLVGARRVYERARAAERLEELGFLAGSTVPRERPVFLFATSAGEVGIDLDADHMVCDLVPWERMVQRLGRVNRRGLGEAQVVVLDPPSDTKSPSPHTERLSAVRELLDRLPVLDGRRDASPGALRDLQRAARDDTALSDAIERASSPDPLYPGLDRPTLDAWALTSLRHHPGRPAVAPWLRGWVEDRPQTTVIWRQNLPLLDGAPPRDAIAKRFFEAAPPHASELLETETPRVSEWLAKRAKRLRKLASEGGADRIKEAEIVGALRSDGDEPVRWWTLKQIDELSKKDRDRQLEGAELFLDVRFGGLLAGMLDASSDDLPPAADAATTDHEGWASVPYRVREVSDVNPIEDPVWRERERFPIEQNGDGEAIRWLAVEKRWADAATEEDRSAGNPQTLIAHQACAAKHAARIAERLGLPPEARRILVVAAHLHDEGKRAARWQAAFHAPPGETPYAKTRGPVNVRLLDGYRHELGSLPYAEQDAEVAGLSDVDRDLVLHLIASHHGFARPCISTNGCEDAPPSALEERAREVALRFARLQARWGPWGLAWWESLLRAADQQASRENDRSDRAEVAAEAS